MIIAPSPTEGLLDVHRPGPNLPTRFGYWRPTCVGCDWIGLLCTDEAELAGEHRDHLLAVIYAAEVRT